MFPEPLDETAVIAAHNARFDRGFLPSLHGCRWLDTMRGAKHLWPDAPNYQNSTLFYWLGFDRLSAGAAPHSAQTNAGWMMDLRRWTVGPRLYLFQLNGLAQLPAD